MASDDVTLTVEEILDAELHTTPEPDDQFDADPSALRLKRLVRTADMVPRQLETIKKQRARIAELEGERQKPDRLILESDGKTRLDASVFESMVGHVADIHVGNVPLTASECRATAKWLIQCANYSEDCAEEVRRKQLDVQLEVERIEDELDEWALCLNLQHPDLPHAGVGSWFPCTNSAAELGELFERFGRRIKEAAGGENSEEED